LLAELFDLGLASAMRSDQGNELSVFPPVGNVTDGDDGFGTLLRSAMAENVDKLREARPRETHLVVTLDRSDVSADPARTPPPDLLEGIDVLWVLLGYYKAKWTYRVWRTTGSRPAGGGKAGGRGSKWACYAAVVTGSGSAWSVGGSKRSRRRSWSSRVAAGV
jgi:hypothetical protein